jgi:hypothetical protein
MPLKLIIKDVWIDQETICVRTHGHHVGFDDPRDAGGISQMR